jgi:hypothetical protein
MRKAAAESSKTAIFKAAAGAQRPQAAEAVSILSSGSRVEVAGAGESRRIRVYTAAAAPGPHAAGAV